MQPRDPVPCRVETGLGAYGGGVAGAVIGTSIIPGVGTGIGAALGALFGGSVTYSNVNSCKYS